MGPRWHLPLRRVSGTPRRVLDRHPATHRVRVAPHGARVQLYPHRHDRPVPTDAWQVGLLPDGVGRQRTPDRASGAELLRRPVRPQPAVPGRLRAAVSRRTAQEPPRHPDLAAELPRTVRRAGRDRRAGVRGVVPATRAERRLEPPLRHDRRAQPPRQPTGVPAQPRPRRGLQPRRPHDVGRRLPDSRRPSRDGRPRATRRLPQDRLPQVRRFRRCADRHHSPRVAGGLRGAGGSPRRLPLPAAVRQHRSDTACTASRCPWWHTSWRSPTRAPGSP